MTNRLNPTITSLGRDGGLGATPIINHPEMAILESIKPEISPLSEMVRLL